MELLVTLKEKAHLERLNKSCDGVIFGALFSNKFNYSLNDLIEIDTYCTRNNLKRYISVDAFINEEDKNYLYDYFEILKNLNPDGIYFSDLGVYNCAKGYDMQDKLIYDPDTLMTNSLDVSFFLNQGLGVVLSREISLNETLNILKKYPRQLDMQIFGHFKMSQSKRKFLSNYFKEINRDVDVIDKNDITLIEETRSYKLPIKENKNGTTIYTDYVFLPYDELPYLSELIKRGIIDSSFIDNSLLFSVISDIKRLNVSNANFIKSTLVNKYPNITFSDGYFYIKTTDKKNGKD